MTELINPQERYHFDEKGQLLAVETEQALEHDFWDDLEEAKENFRMRLDGYTPVASIPAATVDRWIREGFDFYAAPAKEILARLRRDEMTKLIVSGDKTF
jgi:hypothetical protein